MPTAPRPRPRSWTCTWRGQAPYPVVVAIHGGGFLSGDKADGQITPVLEALKRGYAVVGVNYRLSDEARFPAAINDVKAAVRWLRAHAGEYRLDGEPHRRCGATRPAATLAALAGTSGDVPALRGPRPETPTNPTGPGRRRLVRAHLVPAHRRDFRRAGFTARAPTDRTRSSPGTSARRWPPVPGKVRAADPITYITPDDPPILIEHGTADGTVPVGQSERLAKAYAAGAGADAVTLHLIAGAGHVDPAFYEQAHVDDVLDWLDAQLK